MPHQQMGKIEDDCCCVYVESPDVKNPEVMFDTHHQESLPNDERQARLEQQHRFVEDSMETFLEDILQVGETVHLVFGFHVIQEHISIHKDSESEFTVTQYGG